jgi:AcrR family transcriptional regulator
MQTREHKKPRRSSVDARAHVVEAAIRELHDVGVERASLRGIARRVGMTHQAVAYHFPDRTALLTEVAIGGFTELARLMRRALDELKEANGPQYGTGIAVVTIGKAYVRFARDNRSRFELMFRSALLREDDSRLLAAEAEVWDLLRSHVADAIQNGWSGGADPDQMAYGAWATVHGLATLEGNFAAPAIAPERIVDLFDANIAAAGRTPSTGH